MNAALRTLKNAMKTLEQLGISPAPWNARKVSREEGFTGFEVYDDNGNYVLFDGDAGLANCNLIAAAPDMYVALRMYQEVFEKIRKSAWFIDANFHEIMNLNKVMTAADAALAKAAGEKEVEK